MSKKITLIFATHNANKVKELQTLVPESIVLKCLSDIDCMEDIAETAPDLEGNAKLKADYVSKNYQVNCFADDTGLEVDALGGAPGVYSARYAGEPQNSLRNMELILKNLQGKSNRKAQFRTVIALNLEEKQYLFEGVCKGEIISEKTGDSGFGYDQYLSLWVLIKLLHK
jgi:XTP/dITP diphosphohydrolase